MAGEIHDDKPSSTHIDHINNISDNSEQDANEEIVRHLQITGEDVGFTCEYTKNDQSPLQP